MLQETIAHFTCAFNINSPTDDQVLQAFVVVFVIVVFIFVISVFVVVFETVVFATVVVEPGRVRV